MMPLELTVFAVLGFLLITSITLKLDPRVRAAGDRRKKL
jgi:hypothetical protein